MKRTSNARCVEEKYRGKNVPKPSSDAWRETLSHTRYCAAMTSSGLPVMSIMRSVVPAPLCVAKSIRNNWRTVRGS